MVTTALIKKEAISLILNHELSISNASKKYGVARKTIYVWLRKYQNSSTRAKSTSLNSKYVSGQDHPTAVLPHIRSHLLRLIVKHPDWGVRKFSDALNSKGFKVGFVSVYNLLQQLDATTLDKRYILKRSWKGPGRLINTVKLELVKRVVDNKETISAVSKEYKIPRKTIYKWLYRYNICADRGLTGISAFDDQYVRGENHPTAIYPHIQDKVMNLVAGDPALTAQKIANTLSVSTGTIWNILYQKGLNHYEDRMKYAQSVSMEKQVTPHIDLVGRVSSVFEEFTPNVAPAPPPSYYQSSKLGRKFLVGAFITSSVVTFSAAYWASYILNGQSFTQSVGLIFASLALVMGSFFFIYSMKYYLTLAIVLSFSQDTLTDLENSIGGLKGFVARILGITNKNKVSKSSIGLTPNVDDVQLDRYPFISVQIPFFNEKNVVERSIRAATNFDYPGEYEVIACDDSTDVTPEIIKSFIANNAIAGTIQTIVDEQKGWTLTSGEVRPGVTFKHLHRTSRSGFKGGALDLALRLSDPRTEFVSIFDADFVPYPDSLTLFLKYLKKGTGTIDFEPGSATSNVAAVQGYQWHVLNKSENWITRGVRSEYAGSYVIERSGIELYGGLKQISGSVYLVRKDVLQKIGWGTSITEDFELTLKLYAQGYKVLYTPYIQAPSECVSTVKRLIRQRMRWAEGHSFNIKKYILPLLLSKDLSIAEKFELIYLAPYYLQAFFFLLGTFAWFISETVFPARLPFWTALWGWSLVLTNMIALPLMNAVGMFLEESDEKDYVGIISFVVLSYLVVPFQAYAAIKGFLEKSEGPWFRTPKTGRITDTFLRAKLSRFIQGILPGKISMPTAALNVTSPYLALTSANNSFFPVKHTKRSSRLVVRATLAFALFITIFTTNMMSYIPVRNSAQSDRSNSNNIQVDGKKSFSLDELPSFTVDVKKHNVSNNIFSLVAPAYASQSDLKSSVTYAGSIADVKVDTKDLGNGKFSLSLQSTENMRPGKYTLNTQVVSNSVPEEVSYDFYWGVLAINTDKSIYVQGETAQIYFGVVDNIGQTVCDAKLNLVITDPSGKTKTLSTEKDGGIATNYECTQRKKGSFADYSASYKTSQLSGIYKLDLTATTKNGVHEIQDIFEARRSVPYEITRVNFPTRVYPPEPYEVTLEVKANQDYSGDINDYVPGEFEISKINSQGKSVQISPTGRQQIRWNVALMKDETKVLTYTILFPLVSPQYYLLGPANVGDFKEARQWQVAIDTTGGQMTLYFHRENSDAETTYNALSLTKPEVGSDTASGTTTSTVNTDATPPTTLCESSNNNSNTYNRTSATATAATNNRCMASFVSMPVGQSITINTADSSAISGNMNIVDVATGVVASTNMYIYKYSAGTLTRFKTLTDATDPGTTITNVTFGGAAAPDVNNVTLAAGDRIAVIVSRRVTTGATSGRVAILFDSTARTIPSLTLKYTAITANKPSLAGTYDDDFAPSTGTATTNCTAGNTVTNDTKWTCGTSTGNYNLGGTSTIGGDSSNWITLENVQGASLGTNFNTTPTNTYIYQTVDTNADGNGDISTVVNSTINTTAGTSPYYHSGLVLWASDTDYYIIEATYNGTNRGILINDSGTIKYTSYSIPVSTYNEIYLRWTKTNYSYQAYVSADGSTWYHAGPSLDHCTTFTRVGLSVYAGTLSTRYSGAFEWFDYNLTAPGTTGIVLKQSRHSDGSASTLTATFCATPTATNLIVVAAGSSTGLGTTAISDNQAGNTYTRINTAAAGGAGDNLALYYAKNVNSTGTFTITVTPDSAASTHLAIYEYSGADTSNPLDQNTVSTGTSTTPASGNISTTTDNELYFGAMNFTGGFVDEFLPNSNYRMLEIWEDGANGEQLGAEDRIAVQGTYSADWTLVGSAGWAASIASFKPTVVPENELLLVLMAPILWLGITKIKNRNVLGNKLLR